ncbi:GNAT family N-acetyltransferase [Alicyclobacillus acidiphilus]|uniref:GNAT family N-acetyltransferase n=1 Tax=Alicyclobacillus acidiphilus TaxID=182455 RepID=UPI0012ECC3EB|nr:GNAT family N-acetyltransferase [Alicyclobacillus acidiphilus]
MTRTDAEQIANWQYPEPYRMYNMDGTPEAIEELLNRSYMAVDLLGPLGRRDRTLFGFYCVGVPAQVPGMHPSGAYDSGEGDVIDLGLGMRPDATGQGFGDAFLTHILRDIAASHPGAPVRLTVAQWNARAIRLYEKHGFRLSGVYMKGNVAFQVMYRNC